MQPKGLRYSNFCTSVSIILYAFPVLTVEQKCYPLESFRKLSVSDCISYTCINRVYHGSVLQYLGTMDYCLRHTARQQLLEHLAHNIPWLPKCTTDLRVRQAPRGYVELVSWPKPE